MAALILYQFSQGEVLQLRTLVGFLPEVRVIPVERSGYGLTIDEVLAGKEPPALAFGKPMERKLLVIEGARGQMLSMLLSAAGQVTKGQNILRAIVTDTNRAWTGAFLYEHLLEEEAELQARMKEQ